MSGCFRVRNEPYHISLHSFSDYVPPMQVVGKLNCCCALVLCRANDAVGMIRHLRTRASPTSLQVFNPLFPLHS